MRWRLWTWTVQSLTATKSNRWKLHILQFQWQGSPFSSANVTWRPPLIINLPSLCSSTAFTSQLSSTKHMPPLLHEWIETFVEKLSKYEWLFEEHSAIILRNDHAKLQRAYVQSPSVAKPGLVSLPDSSYSLWEDNCSHYNTFKSPMIRTLGKCLASGVHWQTEFDNMADGCADVFVKQVGSGWDMRLKCRTWNRRWEYNILPWPASFFSPRGLFNDHCPGHQW